MAAGYYLTALIAIYPIGMRAVQIAVRIDHFRLNPQAELHAQTVHMVDKRLQPVRELFGINVPVAQTGVIVVALAKPAVVYYKQLNAQLGRLIGELHLVFVKYIEQR